MFGDKQFDNLGFPTPESVPEDTGCRLLSIPSSAAWFAVFMGCLELLTEPQNWQQYEGGMSREDAAAVAQAVIDQAYALAEMDVCVADVPTPYWDESSADDADDTSPVEIQPWYGEIVALPALMSGDELTFVDNLGIWLIAGFIAYAGLPGAAIAFVPVAKRFVLAFKQHSVGGIVRALIDFTEVAEIDTYGVLDGVQTLNIVMPDDDMPHTLYVEMSDEHNPAAGDSPNIQVIRKRLSESEFSPPNLRYNSDCDCVQQTADGGATWTDNPSADPRTADGFRLPTRGGSDPQCDAAANMLDKIKSQVNLIIASLEIIQVVNGLLAIVSVFLPDINIVLEVVEAAAAAALSIGSAAISAAFTDDQYDLLQCILYCDIAADGSVNQAQLDQILSDIHDQADPVVYDLLFFLLPMIGCVGLSNAGATGDKTGDCSGCDCAWTYVWDFTANDGDWEANDNDGHTGSYVPGQGWLSAFYGSGNSYGFYSEVSIWSAAFDLAADARITHWEVNFSAAGTSPGGHYEAWIGANRGEGLGRTMHNYQSEWMTNEGTDGEIDGGLSGQRFAIANNDVSDTVYVRGVRLKGFGTPPDLTGGAFL